MTVLSEACPERSRTGHGQVGKGARLGPVVRLGATAEGLPPQPLRLLEAAFQERPHRPEDCGGPNKRRKLQLLSHLPIAVDLEVDSRYVSEAQQRVQTCVMAVNGQPSVT